MFISRLFSTIWFSVFTSITESMRAPPSFWIDPFSLFLQVINNILAIFTIRVYHLMEGSEGTRSCGVYSVGVFQQFVLPSEGASCSGFHFFPWHSIQGILWMGKVIYCRFIRFISWCSCWWVIFLIAICSTTTFIWVQIPIPIRWFPTTIWHKYDSRSMGDSF